MSWILERGDLLGKSRDSSDADGRRPIDTKLLVQCATSFRTELIQTLDLEQSPHYNRIV